MLVTLTMNIRICCDMKSELGTYYRDYACDCKSEAPVHSFSSSMHSLRIIQSERLEIEQTHRKYYSMNLLKIITLYGQYIHCIYEYKYKVLIHYVL